MSFTPDTPSTEEVLAAALSSSLPPVPPQEQSYASTHVSWWETDPGEVYIHAEGGTGDDRHYASTLVATQLQAHGYRRAQFDPDQWKNPYPNDEHWMQHVPDSILPLLKTPDQEHADQAAKNRFEKTHGLDALNDLLDYGTGRVRRQLGAWAKEQLQAGMPWEEISSDIYQKLRHQHEYEEWQGQFNWAHQHAKEYSDPNSEHNQRTVPWMRAQHGYEDWEPNPYEDNFAKYRPSMTPQQISDRAHANALQDTSEIYSDIHPHGLDPDIFPGRGWGSQPTSPTIEYPENDDEWRFGKTSSWPDLMAKAKRLVQSGQVQVLRNGFNYIQGHVVGDHGDYDVELSRDDPSSRAITGWQCQCPWDQYAWQRTRKWKKFEGRPCHLPGSMVTMADGTYKPIEDVQVGDRVVTHDGVGVVERTMTREVDEEVVYIWRTGFPHPLRMTETHEVWAVRTPQRIRSAAYNQPEYLDRSGQGFKFYRDDFLQEEPEWIDAGGLQERDWVASTWADGELIEAPMALAVVAGYYLAEGNIVANEVQWTFHKDETDLHVALIAALEILNLEYEPRIYNYEIRNSISIRITSSWLVEELTRLCGQGSRAKFINGEIVSQWSIDQAHAFIEAYLEGDGDLKAGNRQALNTASEQVARGFYDLLVRCGHQPSWHVVSNHGGPQNRDIELTINRITFQRKPQTRGNGRKRLNRHYLSMITRIERHPYQGLVYNLKVSGQESYVTEGVTNHNCSHVMALYWKALATPLDEQLTEEQANAMGTGQKLPAPAVADHPPEIEDRIQKGEKPPPEGPRTFGPEGPIQGDQTQMNLPPDALGGQPGPAQAPLTPPGGPPSGPSPAGPEPPGIIPPFPGEQMQMPWAGPGTTPGGGQSPPGAVSVPGAKPQTPMNPMQQPGTYSRIAAEFNPPEIVRLKSPMMGLAEGPEKGQYGDGEYREVPEGSTGEVLSQDPATNWVEIIVPLDQSGYHEPFHVRCFVEPSDIESTNQTPPGPFIQPVSPDWLETLAIAFMAVGGIITFFAVIIALGTIPIWLGWNLGVVGISHAVHGHLHTISFWVALGVSLVIGVVGRPFRRSPSK